MDGFPTEEVDMQASSPRHLSSRPLLVRPVARATLTLADEKRATAAAVAATEDARVRAHFAVELLPPGFTVEQDAEDTNVGTEAMEDSGQVGLAGLESEISPH